MFGHPGENRFETEPPGPKTCDRCLIKNRIGIRPNNGALQKSATSVNADGIAVVGQLGIDAMGQSTGSLTWDCGSFTIYSQEGAVQKLALAGP
jgi:hypothetical protein